MMFRKIEEDMEKVNRVTPGPEESSQDWNMVIVIINRRSQLGKVLLNIKRTRM